MTMKELAKLAGVSSSAVSRYLNGGSLSQDKRDRIKKAIEMTGYQPNAAAQMLRTRTTNYVGLIISKMDSDAATRVTRGVTNALARDGYLALLANASNDPEKEVEYIRLFQNRKVAGIILMATVMTPQLEELLKTTSVPIIVVGQRFRQVPCVYHDDFGAAYDLTGLLLKKGRKKLALIGVTEKDVAVGQNRRRGVEAAMADMALDPSDLIYTVGDFTLDSGRAAMEQLLDNQSDIDGLICATDRMAFGAIDVLQKKGFRIPEDISVVGFDNDWAGQLISPHLTTAEFYHTASGESAVSLLMDMLDKEAETSPLMQTMLGYRIVERDSV